MPVLVDPLPPRQQRSLMVDVRKEMTNNKLMDVTKGVVRTLQENWNLMSAKITLVGFSESRQT
jgi:hypothetical protein